MKRTLLITSMLFMCSFLNMLAQEDTINNYDAQNQKHGTWVKKYSSGKVRYQARFEHGRPVGTMKRYHMNGNLKAVMDFKTPKHVYTELYNREGKKRAEGLFVNQKKDSLWTIFDARGRIVGKDNYKMGQLHGNSIRFYPDGDTSQVLHWKNGTKDGIYKQFFENNEVKLIGYYVEGNLDGPLTIFYPNGFKKLEGEYENNLRDGKWVHYDEHGDTTRVIEYIKGEPENENQLEQEETQEVIELENNKGKFDDPRNMLYERNRRNMRNRN